MFNIRRYRFISSDPREIRAILTFSKTKNPSFYEGSQAEERIRRAGLIHLFDLY